VDLGSVLLPQVCQHWTWVQISFRRPVNSRLDFRSLTAGLSTLDLVSDLVLTGLSRPDLISDLVLTGLSEGNLISDLLAHIKKP
jgi:hypothetical protein